MPHNPELRRAYELTRAEELKAHALYLEKGGRELWNRYIETRTKASKAFITYQRELERES